MRFNEFNKITGLLSEVSMKPGALASAASAINATCGLEFEMYVPFSGNMSTDDEPENDYSDDPTVYSIQDIVDFYGDVNSSSIQRTEEELNEKYQEWKFDQIDAAWQNNDLGLITDYIFDSYNLKTEIPNAYEALEFSDEQIELAEAYRTRPKYNAPTPDGAKELYTQAENYVREMAAEEADLSVSRQDRVYDEVKDDYINGEYESEDFSEEMFLRSERIVRMSHVEDPYSLYWPNQTSGGLDDALESLADEIEKVTGLSATFTDKYHGAEYAKGDQYVIEPDSSLDNPPDSSFMGIEIVSPAIPYNSMIEQITIIQNWARQKGCKTSSDTGLHMNVSLDNVAMEDLDYVKLALLVGDQHVLSQFGRTANTFCTSTLGTLGEKIARNPAAVAKTLDALKSDLASTASDLIFPGNSDKMVSLNRKDNRLEFRSPGNNWINTDVSSLQTTLSRFVTAMNIACDPSAYKQEYAKKLYKLIDKSAISANAAAAFSYYASGTADVDTIKQKVYNNPKSPYGSTANTDQPATNQTPDAATLKQKLAAKQAAGISPQSPYGDVKATNQRWFVSVPGETKEVLVTAPTKVVAVQQARVQLKLNKSLYPDNMFRVIPDIQRDMFSDRPHEYTSPEREEPARKERHGGQNKIPYNNEPMLDQTPGSMSFRDAFGALSSSFPREQF